MERRGFMQSIAAVFGTVAVTREQQASMHEGPGPWTGLQGDMAAGLGTVPTPGIPSPQIGMQSAGSYAVTLHKYKWQYRMEDQFRAQHDRKRMMLYEEIPSVWGPIAKRREMYQHKRSALTRKRLREHWGGLFIRPTTMREKLADLRKDLEGITFSDTPLA